MESGIYNLKNPRKIPYPGDGDMGFRGRRIPNQNPRKIFIPGVCGFLSPGFLEDGDFSGMGIFFRGMGYPTKKPPLLENVEDRA